MSDERPFFALVSQVLIAFVIEADNEFERQMPHRTTVAKAAAQTRDVPWLVSLAMWSHFMRFVDEDGVRTADFVQRARLDKGTLRRWLARMSKWWGYVVVTPEAPGAVIRPTAAGRRAIEIWRPLTRTIEDRWRMRFGAREVAALRQSLCAFPVALDERLPEFMPILGHGLRAPLEHYQKLAPMASSESAASRLDLPALLSRLLIAFTIAFERESDVSLAICANVLRILTERGVRARDVPSLCGISIQAAAVAVGFLERGGHVVTASDRAAGLTKLVALTSHGLRTRDLYERCAANIAERWDKRFGADAGRALRETLRGLTDRKGEDGPLMAGGLMPPPGGWRSRKPYLAQTAAFVRDPRAALPYYPLVLHRGGWPDGS